MQPHEPDSLTKFRDANVYLAAERTFLSWIRTGLALMGFGFVVARFGLLMRELAAARPGTAPQHAGISTQFGTALVMLGVALTVGSALRYVSLLRQLDRGDIPRGPSKLAIALAAALAVLGCVVGGYLLRTA
jgi:putative membrane protein